MNNKHLLIVAVVLGLLAVVLVNRTIATYEAKADIKLTTLFRAEVDIAPGAKTLREALDERLVVAATDIPVRVAGAYPEALREEDVQENRETRIERGIRAGEFLHQHHLQGAASAATAPRKIPAGKRMISLVVTNYTATAYFVRPGDRVDLYQVVVVADPTERGGARAQGTRICEGAVVLAVDAQWRAPTDEGSKRGETYDLLTLAVAPDDLEPLLLARWRGREMKPVTPITVVPSLGSTPGVAEGTGD